MIHVYRYISALTALLVAFTTYAVAVAPWFEAPPLQKRMTVAESAPTTQPMSDETKNELASLFPPGHWVLGNPKIVETEQCTLLIQDYKPVEGGNLVLEPCVLIFRAGGMSGAPADGSRPAKRARPIILEAPKAELAFDKPLNITRGAFGRVEKGTLAGEVSIYSPPTMPGGSDELRVRTRAVWLDRQSIRTSNEVEFQYGDSSGRGSILEIALRSGEDADKKKGKTQLGAVQTITLKRLQYLRLASTGRGVLGDAIPAAKTAAANVPTTKANSRPANENAPIEVRCQGEFSFDVVGQLARFEKQVEVKRLFANAPPDQLHCDELLLAFADRKTPPVVTPNDDPLAGRLQRLVAVGSPAVLEAPTSGLRAVAAHMEYSVAARTVILKSDSRRNVPQVSLQQNEQHFVAPEVHYQMAESSRLGKLHATGPGELRMVQGEGAEQQTIIARWEKTLQIQPQDQFQLISLIQAASVTIDPIGRFDGNELHLWTQEVAAGAGGEGRGAGNRAQKTSLTPHRLVAEGGVRVVSQQLDVDTGRLEAWFISQPAEEKDIRPLGLPQPIHEPVGPAAYSPEGSPQAAIRNVVKQPTLQRFHVGGDKIQLQAIVRGRLFDLEDLIIDGKADILETRTPEPNQEPIFARGASLELRQGSKPDATTVQINGQPAEVGGRGMSLAGRSIDVERGKNELRIDGLGEARMPVSRFRLPNGSLPGQFSPQEPSVPTAAFAQPQKLHIIWHHGLIFDGLVARFAGNVEMRTATQLALAPVLEVTLNQRWDFQAAGGQSQPELARVFLDGGIPGVYVKNDGLDETGQMISREQMKARSLTVDQLAGKLHVAGPGWVCSVRRGSAGLSGAANSPGFHAANQPLANPQQLTSVHVAFEKEMVGDLATRQVEFRRQVETTYSPATDFGNVIAADIIGNLQKRMFVMTSDVLTVTEFVHPPARWFELLATGSTKVRGQKVDVDAPIVGYSSDKETLKIEGDGRADAKAWLHQTAGDDPARFQGQRLTYNLRTGELRTDVISNLHFNLGPQIKLPVGTPFTGGTQTKRP